MASVQEDRRRNLKDQEKRSRPRSRSGPDDRGANRPLAPRALDLSQRRVGSLSTDPKNARTHDDKQIAQLEASIARFGFTNPLLIDERDVIIAGHARLAAAIGVGLDVVPAIVVTGL